MALQAIQLPAPVGYVNDFANAISAESETMITRIIEDVRAKSGGEIAVVTLADIGLRNESEWALAIGRQWGVGASAAIGDRRRNAGVVILLVPKETNSSGRGACRIETAQGTEGFITDGEAGAICREATPLFAQRDYSAGLLLVTRRVADRFAAEFGFTIDTSIAPPLRQETQRAPGTRMVRGFPPQAVFFLIIFVLMFLRSIGGGRRGRRGRRSGCGGCFPIFLPMGSWGGGGGFSRGGGWGGGGGGFGGFGGFGGGGGFSGGGGGSSW
jgi:uncharacterized protein